MLGRGKILDDACEKARGGVGAVERGRDGILERIATGFSMAADLEDKSGVWKEIVSAMCASFIGQMIGVYWAND